MSSLNILVIAWDHFTLWCRYIFINLVLDQIFYLNKLYLFPFVVQNIGKNQFYWGCDLKAARSFYDKWLIQMNSRKLHIFVEKFLFYLFWYRVRMSLHLNQQQTETNIKTCRWWHLNWVLKHEKELWEYMEQLILFANLWMSEKKIYSSMNYKVQCGHGEVCVCKEKIYLETGDTTNKKT